MSDQELKNIPTEILWRICSYIESSHRLSVHALSMTSKQIRSAVLPILFRKIKITMQGEEDLKRRLATLPQEFTKHIRQLVIQGWIPKNQEELEEITATYNNIPREELNSVEDQFVQPNLSLWKALGERIFSQTREVTTSENNAWKPLADFVANIPVLHDLFFNSACQLPPCLLQSLHWRVASCRLHMNTFRLRTLEPGPSPVLHFQEMDIIRSPCLYSVTTNFYEYFGQRHTCSYFNHVFADIVGKYAPNMKELYIFHEFFHDPRCPPYYGPRQKPQWQGFRANQTHERDTRPLHVDRSLSSLGSSGGIILKAINVSGLRSMYCTTAVYSEVLQFMLNECHFDSLTRLRLTLHHRLVKRATWQITTEQYDSNASSFLSRLPALTELMCDGHITQSKFNLILNSIGPKLEVLCIQQTIWYGHGDSLLGTSDELCSNIAKSCPHLSYVSVKLLREEIATGFRVENGVLQKYVP
jgi:hypothetical protein